jgi:hypothetical protein
MPPRRGAKPSRRPKLTTKEELLKYLEENKDTELPFNETVWGKAVQATKDKERQYKELQTKEFDGTTKIKKIPNGTINPVGKYFQMMALPQYAKNPVYPESDETESEREINDELTSDFEGYRIKERQFLAERLAEYYENYEINTGSDKFIVNQIVVFELELKRLNMKLASGKDVYNNIEKVTKQYLNLCESLKTLKKQRGAMEDEGKNKFTLFVDELEKEGEFKYSFDDVSDAIDEMLDIFEKSMIRTYNEG